MLGKTLYAASPVVFLALAAQPVPDHWDFAFFSLLGAFAGACARVGVALYAGVVATAAKSVFLTFASFWLGMIGAMACHAIGYLDAIDPVKIMAVAALCALFGVVLEMLGAQLIRARARKEFAQFIEHKKETDEN